jgi:hypothetical protein
MTVERLAPRRKPSSIDLDADTQDIIDIATMLCAVTASGDAEGCASGINKSLWTIIDRAEAIRERLLKDDQPEAS